VPMDLTNASFAYSDLTSAIFLSFGDSGASAVLTNADFTGAILTNVRLDDNQTLAKAVFAKANLTNTDFENSTLTNADFSGATVQGTNFNHFGNSALGISWNQLVSTASYATREMMGIRLVGLNLNGGNFSNQDLTAASLWGSNLSEANFTNANLTHVY